MGALTISSMSYKNILTLLFFFLIFILFSFLLNLFHFYSPLLFFFLNLLEKKKKIPFRDKIKKEVTNTKNKSCKSLLDHQTSSLHLTTNFYVYIDVSGCRFLLFFPIINSPSKADQIKLDLGFSMKEVKNENPFRLSDFWFISVSCTFTWWKQWHYRALNLLIASMIVKKFEIHFGISF